MRGAKIQTTPINRLNIPNTHRRIQSNLNTPPPNESNSNFDGCASAYEVVKVGGFDIYGVAEELTCLGNYLCGINGDSQNSPREKIPIAHEMEMAIGRHCLKLLKLVPGKTGYDNDNASIAVRVALALFGLEYSETVLLYVKGTQDCIVDDIRRRLWKQTEIVAIMPASGGVYVQVPPNQISAASELLRNPESVIQSDMYKCFNVELYPNCEHHYESCPLQKIYCEVVYPADKACHGHQSPPDSPCPSPPPSPPHKPPCGGCGCRH